MYKGFLRKGRSFDVSIIFLFSSERKEEKILWIASGLFDTRTLPVILPFSVHTLETFLFSNTMNRHKIKYVYDDTQNRS